MLEILGIRTGVVEEIDSDDEFDIEHVGAYFKGARGGMGPASVPLSPVEGGVYASGQRGTSPSPGDRPHTLGRRNSGRKSPSRDLELLRTDSNDSDGESDISDLPPMTPSNLRRGTRSGNGEGSSNEQPTATPAASSGITAGGAFNSLTGIFSGTSDDQAEWFRKLDEGYIKPTLLLDPGKGTHNGSGNVYGRGGV